MRFSARIPIGTNANGAVTRISIIAADRTITEQTEESALRNTALKRALTQQACQQKASRATPIRPIHAPRGGVDTAGGTSEGKEERIWQKETGA